MKIDRKFGFMGLLGSMLSHSGMERKNSRGRCKPLWQPAGL